MKKLIGLLLISTICIATTRATSLIDDLKVRYPNADAVYLKLKKDYRLNADGSVDFHYYHQLAYLTPYAFNSQYGESFILYNPEFQSLKIIKAETLTPDGRKIAAPANAFNEVLPSSAANAPAYTHLKEMVVSHTGLETGALVLLEYVIHSKAGFSMGLMGNETVMMASPVQEMQFEITTPSSVKLAVATFNIAPQAQVSTRNKQQRYSWAFSDIASEAGEPMVLVAAKPRVVFSTQSIATQMQQLNKDISGQVSADLQTWITTHTLAKDSTLQKVLAIQKGIVDEMNVYPVALEQAAFRFRKPDAVFQTNGGTEIEKTVLMATILKSQGMDAEVVGTMPTWMQHTANAENLLLMSHFYVRVTIDKKPRYLSAIEINTTDEVKLLNGMIVIDQMGKSALPTLNKE